MYIGIRNGKIWDITSDLENKRLLESDGITPVNPKEIKYILLSLGYNLDDYFIDDTYDDVNGISLKDSYRRTENPEQTKLQELEARIAELESKIPSTKIP